MSTLDVLSVVIGLCNPLSASLTGPFLARRVSAARARQIQGAGWAVLFFGQLAFLTYGVLSAVPGFRWIQPLMIVVAGVQFWEWRRTQWAQPSRELTSRSQSG
jgi:hypothetical protein